MTIDLESWLIRSYSPDDVPAVARHADNPRVAANLRDRFPHPYTEDHAREWIGHCLEQRPERNFAIATAREVIGGIGLELQQDVHRRSAEIGFWLAEPYWGQGIMTRVLRAMTDYALVQFDLIRLFAMVFEFNPASARVLEKAGFAFEGRLRMSVIKNGRVLDQLLYAYVRSSQEV
jgi:RimJ/RimL family protein N-acetyltransferase